MELSPRYDGPPIISIAGAPDDQLAPVVRQRRRTQAMLADLSEDDWCSPTRCDVWNVQDVVAHMVSVNDFWTASMRAGLAGVPTRMMVGFDPAATPELFVGPMRELEPRAVLDRYVASNDAFVEVIEGLDDGGWGMLAESPAGHVPIRLIAHHALWDTWIHERDIALPLGLTTPEEPDEVASCLRYAAALSPALAIGSGQTIRAVLAVEASEPDTRFVLDVGESVALYDGAAPSDAPCLRGPAVALVEAVSLREPLPASTPPEWFQLLGGLAAAFDGELLTNS
jgi:uncharacterized protein (TIGR03083 family)